MYNTYFVHLAFGLAILTLHIEKSSRTMQLNGYYTKPSETKRHAAQVSLIFTSKLFEPFANLKIIMTDPAADDLLQL